jgi:LacI family transcriptional regulator
MATMKDVARKAGVSVATVSAVLSGAAFVSDPLKVKVQKAIAELGYARNAVARSLKQGHSSLIGLVVPDINNPFFTSFVDHVQNAADAAGYTVLLGHTRFDYRRELPVLDLIRSQQAAGTILCPIGPETTYASIGQRMGNMKMVLADNGPEQCDVDTVVMQNEVAAELAALHIIRHGHRRIAMVTGPDFQFVSQRRHQAFIRALARESIDICPRLIAQGDFRDQEAYVAAKQLLKSEHKPSAIFAANNLMLIGVMRAITEAGLRVPEDISVVSIDDFAWAAAFQPKLTVVRQPIAELAQAAFAHLLRRISGDASPVQRSVFPPELIIRQSCGPLSKALS